ncbi:type VII secretion integral membrane protein EccD [Tsukamurella ocularis]|uniref:type VII secretion integral membrane protein EccD n=1 Tax=Tsukamurella ocularis TaxID=1970234 RepID=UPI0021678B9F|nr:type VII secretion integral membrane protein EccD [Tsukamurella ocularis]MCS3853326.1 type VII secretion integral membrane protein EccD [Tsukamurella ocularis]
MSDTTTAGADAEQREDDGPRMVMADITRTAVIFGDRKHDVALAAGATVIDTAHGLLPLLTQRHEALGAPVPDLAGVIVLRRLDGTALPMEKTLDDAGVEDGQILVLTSQPTPETLQLITEEISTALAEKAAARFPSIREENAVAVGSTLLALSAVAMVATGYLGWRPRVAELGRGGWEFATALTMGAGALVLFALAAVATLSWKLRSATIGTLAGGSILASATAFFAVPSTPSAAHVLFASATAAVVGLVLLKIEAPAQRAWVALLVGGIALALASAARLLVGWSVDQIAVAVPILALTLARFADVFAARLTRAPLAPFPTVTGGLVFDNATKLTEAAVVATETDWEPPSPPQLLQIAEKANAWITAILLTAGIGTIAATPVILTPGKDNWWLRLIYVGLVVVLLILGGRNFGDRWHSIIMVTAGVGMVLAGAIRIAGVEQSVGLSVFCAAVVFAVGVLGLVATVIVPQRAFTAPVRWWLTVSTWILTAPLVPLVLWLLGTVHFARYH